jgi:hypothetical protein
MIVIVLGVVAFAGLNALKRDHDPTPVRAVDYQAMVRAGRADHKLSIQAPATLPAGWKATSADYLTGSDPTWHLGVLTDQGDYIGVEEARGAAKDLVEEHVDPDAVQGEDVTIGGVEFETWTDAGGDYALSHEVRTGETPTESWLVVGTAPKATIRDYAARLKGGPVPDAG